MHNTPLKDDIALKSRAAFSEPALVAFLRSEMLAMGIACPALDSALPAAVSRWYVAVAGQLERRAAAQDGRSPITRDELGLLCRVALTADNLRHAVALCCQFCDALTPRAGHLSIETGKGTVSVHLNSLRAVATPASSLSDIMGLFGFYQLFQWLVGMELPLQQVHIGPLQRDNLLPLLALFRAPVLARGEDCALFLPPDVLKLPVVRTSADFDAFFSDFPGLTADRLGGDTVGQMAAVLTAAARQGTDLPTQSEFASLFGMSLSGLRRRLAEAGSSYRYLRRNALRDVADTLLADRRLSVTEIALQLGFSDSNAFRRAYRQWTGFAPTRHPARRKQ